MSIIIDNKIINTTPKCGSTSIHKLFKVKKNYNILIGETTASIMRNPYDLLVSWYLYSNLKSFEQFLIEYNNTKFIRDGRLFWMYQSGDVLIRLDNINFEVSKYLGYSINFNVRYNATPFKRGWPVYYNQTTIEIAEERFRSDFKLWRSRCI